MGEKIARSLKILPICNSGRFYKRQEITSSTYSRSRYADWDCCMYIHTYSSFSMHRGGVGGESRPILQANQPVRFPAENTVSGDRYNNNPKRRDTGRERRNSHMHHHHPSLLPNLFINRSRNKLTRAEAKQARQHKLLASNLALR